MAFRCHFKTALGRRVVTTPWLPAPTSLSNAEPGKQSDTNRAIPEESSAHPAPPEDDSSTNQVPPAASSPPKSHMGRTGEGAWQRTPTLTGRYHTLRPRTSQHYRSPPVPSTTY